MGKMDVPKTSGATQAFDANPAELWWGRKIYLNEFYFISYGEQLEALREELKQDYTLEQARADPRFKAYFRTLALLPQFRPDVLAKLAPEQNPNNIRITGSMLIEWAKSGFVPQFDRDFDRTRRVVMIRIENYEKLLMNKARREREERE